MQKPRRRDRRSLGRALFGDPAAAAEQRKSIAQSELMAAQTGMASEHGRLYGTQADGQASQNGGSTNLAGLIKGLIAPPAPPVAMPSGPVAALPEPVAAPQIDFAAQLPGVLAAIAQAQGDKVDMGATMQALGGMLGNDEYARRGMVAAGQTPGENFALTQGHADAISARDAGEDYTKATGVATINNRDDMPIAVMRDGTTRRGQDLSSFDRRRGQDIGSVDRHRGQDIGSSDRRSKAASASRDQVRPISASAYQMLFGVADDPDKPGELTKQIRGRGWGQIPDDGTLVHIRSSVIEKYRLSGNPVQAVGEALNEVKRRWDRKQRGTASATQPPVAGARRAPDGLWYKQIGQNTDGSPKYARVGE